MTHQFPFAILTPLAFYFEYGINKLDVSSGVSTPVSNHVPRRCDEHSEKSGRALQSWPAPDPPEARCENRAGYFRLQQPVAHRGRLKSL